MHTGYISEGSAVREDPLGIIQVLFKENSVMKEIWTRNILSCLEIVRQSTGPNSVIIVSGSEEDSRYWQEQLEKNRFDVFRNDGNTTIFSVSEFTRKGNFLGTLNAFRQVYNRLQTQESRLSNVSLMSMVFGKGKRLSPFTQALGDRKPAFPTPMWVPTSSSYLQMVDLSNLYSNLLLEHLHGRGFQGVLIKWGDEAIIPGTLLESDSKDYNDLDVIRMVMKTRVTEELAREKEWIVIDPDTELMTFELTRQDISSLKHRLSSFQEKHYALTLNLGTSAVCYKFLQVAENILGEDIIDPKKWVDWDPYVWIALFCETEEQWRAEIEYEIRLKKTGILQLIERYPDFYHKMQELRRAYEAQVGRSLRVGVLDLGKILWIDFGLHTALRRSLETLTDPFEGALLRDVFGIPHARDVRGNIIIRSQLPPSIDIRNSILIDTIIRDQRSILDHAVIIGGRHNHVSMPHGGSALFCATDTIKFEGPHSVAFRSIDQTVILPEGGRHTTLFLDEGRLNLVSNESIVSYEGNNYTLPILGNSISFERAGAMMSEIGGQEIDRRWYSLWSRWL